MKSVMTYVAIAALATLPVMVDAQGKGNGNGPGNGNGNGNRGNAAANADRGNGNGNDHRGGGRSEDHGPEARGGGKGNGPRQDPQSDNDLARIAGAIVAANGLVYLSPDVDFGAISDEDLSLIANCPPGLAKKNPPCVPPGLARSGVTYDQWTGYDPDDLRELYDDQWSDYAFEPVEPQDTDLTQREIADIFGLEAAPEGQRYAVIDGRPVLLNDTDYERLLTLNGLAQRPTFDSTVPVATDAVLTQDQLIARYGLAQPDTGQNYSVLDNQLIALPDDAYGLLQLIRILGAV